MSTVFPLAFIVFIACFPGVPILLWLMRLIGLYVIVPEGMCYVYVLFGKVVAIIDEPGFHFLIFKITWRAPIVGWLGRRYVVDMRFDQEYLRSLPVNSEEGAPMGIGVWYEMYVSDPVSFIFKNVDPRGSLGANVSNAVVRCLSNLRLSDMLENRHSMSQVVRAEVSPQSNEWGYELGSIYIRKVHFRDSMMIRQIEEKVVNRLRQVTSAIKQDGANQVSVIASSAEKQAAVEFAKAAAIRPKVVGDALGSIAKDSEVANVMFELLEYQKLLEAKTNVTLIPSKSEILRDLLVGGPVTASVSTHEQIADLSPSGAKGW